jgi:hypothetical protein
MRTYLLATTAALALAAPAAAETISTAVTQPVRTSTIKAGAPDAITIAAAGSVKPASGTAVTMDSNHAVTNQGAIAISNADGAIGIRANAGLAGDLVNSGTITIDETYAPTDTDNDGDLDGRFAIGTGRYGIRTDGALTGKLTNSGTITVEGNDSAGIWLGGPLTGAFTHDGTTTVTGDRAVGVRADAISGNARLAGTVTARGVDAVGARFAGDIGGSLVVQGAISASGYRYTTPPANAPSLDSDDLLQGGSALLVEGNVAGGIVLAAAPKDSNPADNDEDKDGIEDAKEGTAAVTAFGAAPAMVIGASGRDIAIGAVPGTGSGLGLIVEGAINGNGVYAGVDGNGLVIAGRGGKVAIAGGIGVSGSIAAASNGASATALRLGSGATVPDLRVSGTISAAGGNAATARTTAIQIDDGASLPALRVSGTVKATAAGTSGTAIGVIDRSGTLALVENSGTISASGAATDSGRNVAFDLSANTTGVTLRQTVVATATAPSITGDVRFGTGNDLFDVADGSVKGDVFMGAGNNAMRLSGDAVHSGRASFGAGADVLSLAGTSVFNGVADFGGGADSLTLAGTSRFSGGLANAGSLTVAVNGGTLAIASPVAIGSLSVGAGGVLEVTLDKDAGQGTLYTIAGAADFAAGATMNLRLADIDNAEGRYTVLQASSISGLAGLKTTTGFVPFLFKATVAANAPANTIAVDVARRTAQELGLNRSGASAYDAVFKAVAKDDGIEDFFLAIADGDQFRAAVRQILPDHAGGAFEGVSLGARTFARQVADPQSPVYSVGGFDLLFNVAGWTSQKDEGATADYDLTGFGISLGGEVDSTIGAFGATLGLFLNEQQQGGNNPVTSETYELAVHWRGNWGGLAAHARGSVGRVNFDERRTLAGKYGDKSIERTAEARWNGTLTTLMGGASYELGSDAFFIRPMVGVDYVGLSEEAHSSTGGGKGLDLAVEKRSSDEFAANGGVAVGVDFYGSRRGDQNWLRVEGEGGWREIVGGGLGDTVARFGDGPSFTLAPEQTASGWFARLRAMGGSEMFEIGGELGAEDRHDNTALTMRGSLRIGF